MFSNQADQDRQRPCGEAGRVFLQLHISLDSKRHSFQIQWITFSSPSSRKSVRARSGQSQHQIKYSDGNEANRGRSSWIYWLLLPHFVHSVLPCHANLLREMSRDLSKAPHDIFSFTSSCLPHILLSGCLTRKGSPGSSLFPIAP